MNSYGSKFVPIRIFAPDETTASALTVAAVTFGPREIGCFHHS